MGENNRKITPVNRTSIDGVIVLLGAPNEPDGKLSSIAIERCEQAINAHAANPSYRILPTGGFGKHFNTAPHPHGYYTTRYLISRGIPAAQILPVAESRFTEEDATLSREFLQDYALPELVLVTSDFHLKRASHFFTREFPDIELRSSPSTTNLPNAEIAKLVTHEKSALQKSITMSH